MHEYDYDVTQNDNAYQIGKIDSLKEVAEKMVQALTEIKDTCGKVCEEFELCTHESCRSSVRAWMIAEKALRDCGGMLKEE